jgi:hypothetical protein
VAATQMGADVPVVLRVGARVVAAQMGVNAPATGSTEIVTFIGGTALPPQTSTMVTVGSKPLSGTPVPTVGGLPSPRPTMLSGPR